MIWIGVAGLGFVAGILFALLVVAPDDWFRGPKGFFGQPRHKKPL